MFNYANCIFIITLEGNCRFKPLKLKLGRLKRHCNDMGTLMAALVKYADSDVPRIPSPTMTRQGRERRAAIPRGSSITRWVMEIMVSVKRIWILWLIPTRRTRVSGVEVKRQIVMGLQILTRIA